MSQSREFANQSNISQQLEGEIGGQRGASERDIFNDAQSFEQQFLIGTAVHQKAKFVEGVSKIFKKSKKLKDITGLSDDDLDNIAKGDFSKISSKIANKASQKISDAKSAIEESKTARLSKESDLETLKTDLADKETESTRAMGEKDIAEQNRITAEDQLASARNEEAALPDQPDDLSGLETSARLSRAEANNGASTADADEAERAAGELDRTARAEEGGAKSLDDLRDNTARVKISTGENARPIDNEAFTEANDASIIQRKVADGARSAAETAKDRAQQVRNEVGDEQQRLNDVAARSESDLEKARSGPSGSQDNLDAAKSQARSNTTDAESQLQTATGEENDANESAAVAAKDAADARSGVQESESALEGGSDEAAAAASKVADLTKTLKAIKDTDEAAAASEEVDPLGIIVAAIGAIGASIIGRKIKTHTMAVTTPDIISSSYASTVGA
ncbi:MAG: Uncharacterised protein [Owenweeksia sp. TMED14]|nr:MAG: Uncharacterised protein [Owenweeksia sp. TMED14]